MLKSHLKKAFTLVELIVVITILAILGTIGFVSFQGFAETARDSARLSDIKVIESSIEYYMLDNSKYPSPTAGVDITYKGNTLWTEGTFGSGTRAIVGRISNVPVDPITGNEYTYSVTEKGNEYQLGYALETGGWFSYKDENSLFKETYAGESSLRTSISGNYNGKAIITSTGGIDYVLAVPTIITSNHSDTLFENIIANKKLAFDGYSNLPSSYLPVIGENDKYNFNFSQLPSLVFEGDLEELIEQDNRLLLYQKISDVYIYSDLEGVDGYTGFSAGFIDKFNPTFDYVNIACLAIEQLIDRSYGCLGGLDQAEDILAGEAFTGALLDNGETNYIGQWLFAGAISRFQGLGGANHERSSMGMYGGLNKSIGVKWKLFTSPKAASFYLGGNDINNDGNDNLIYGFGGKLLLGDTVSGENIWETKVLDIKAILGVENILADGTKSIIVALGTDRYVGVINGSNGDLDWISNSADGPIKYVKQGWPSLDYKVFDINGDGINEYHFKRRYNKYHSYEFFESAGKVIGETLWSSDGYGSYNELTTDGYQVRQWAMGNISGKLVVGTKGSNTYSFYSNDVNSGLSGIDKFKMPAFGKLYTALGTWASRGRNSGIGYFYDINGDGNDEYISKLDEELNNYRLSRLFVSGVSSTGAMTSYMSLSNPENIDASGSLLSYGSFSTPIALKNTSNLEDSYILSKGRDPVDGVDKWMMFKYNGVSASGFKNSSNRNESFNYDITYDIFDSSYSVAGIFNNGDKDYTVLYKGGEYYFYTFTGTGTFSSTSILKVAGSFFGNTIFDGGYDINREKNKNAGVFMASFDTDGNGKKEFVVSSGGYFKFYEIDDSGVNLTKSFGSNSISGVKKWGLTEDNKNIYAITYNGTTNNINYYRTNSVAGDYTFTQITSDYFYAGGEVRDIEISKLGSGVDSYNKVLIKYLGMFDARDANPSNPPIKLSSDFFNSYDMDRDGENEVFIGGKAYTFNSPGNYSLKYNYTGWAGDVDGDGVLDQAWAYCTSTDEFLYHLFYTIRSGIDGSQIIPDLDWGNGSGYCSGGGKYSNVSEDFDGDGIDELAIGVNARYTRLISLSGSTASGFTLEEGNSVRVYSSMNLVAFDFDGDGMKEIIRGHDSVSVYKGNPLDKTNLTHLLDIPSGVKSTWGLALGLPSFYRFNDVTYIAFRGADGEVVLKSWDGSTLRSLFNNYYQDTKIYSSSDDLLNNNLIPLATADVLLGKFMGDDELQVLIGGGDGYVYIVSLEGDILRAFNIGTAIKKMSIGDINGDLLLDIIVSAEDGYIYQIGSSRIAPPGFVKDGYNVGSDINSQTERKIVGVNFASVEGATGYFIQLYNYTSQSLVFDWIDVGNITSKCVISSDFVDETCIDAGKNFYLSTDSVYQWRVQAYNDDISSPTSLSNGFYIEE